MVKLPYKSSEPDHSGGLYIEPDTKYNVIIVDGIPSIQLLDEDGMPYETVPIPISKEQKEAIRKAKAGK